MNSTTGRPSRGSGLSASEANEIGRASGIRRNYPAKGKSWGWLTGTAINKIDGTDDIPRSTILSGVDALESIKSSDPRPVPLSKLGNVRCNCIERRRRFDVEALPPLLREDGVCLSCGVLR